MNEYLASWHATMKLLRAGKSFSGRESNVAYLNGGHGRFAKASSILGLDAPDDGRAVAVVDWDQDGDLDLWYGNRTGPRLRLMRNQTVSLQSPSDRFVALQLQGTRCNRDAIGARVRVEWHDPRSQVRIDTLTAGDAYLSQSSKWIHIALGPGEEIRRIHVRWPGGDEEAFEPVTTGARYMLRQGTGRAEQLASRAAVNWRERQPMEPPPQITARTLLVSPVPLPREFELTKSNAISAASSGGARQRWLCFWASWCPTCVAELRAIAAQQARLDAAGIDFVAVNVDHLATVAHDPDVSPRAILASIDASFPSIEATRDMLEKLQIIKRIVLNQEPPFAVPQSLLVDSAGNLTALYLGRVDVDTVLTDAAAALLSPVERRNRAIPFPGVWSTPPATLLLRPVASVFREHGYEDEFQHYLELDQRTWEAKRFGPGGARRDVDRQYAETSFELAEQFRMTRQWADAIQYFERGLASMPDSAMAHHHLASARWEQGQKREAIVDQRRAVELNPDTLELREQLVRFLRMSRQWNDAERESREILRRFPDHIPSRFQAGVIAAALGQRDLAAEYFQFVIERRPEQADAWANLGSVRAQQGRAMEARDALLRALQIDDGHMSARMALGGVYLSLREGTMAEHEFRKVLSRAADLRDAHDGLTRSLLLQKDYRGAIAEWRTVLARDPGDATSRLQLAWVLATCPDDSVRDGPEAVELATELQRDIGAENPRVLDVWAAALAEVGDFSGAERAVRLAIEQLPDQHPMRPKLDERRRAYSARQPFRDGQ